MSVPICPFFFFNDTATTEIYTLSLHDALPIWLGRVAGRCEVEAEIAVRGPLVGIARELGGRARALHVVGRAERSEEHTSELQSQSNLVCRLLLEKKKRHTLSASLNISHK